jgi:hypothetical protein
MLEINVTAEFSKASFSTGLLQKVQAGSRKNYAIRRQWTLQ